MPKQLTMLGDSDHAGDPETRRSTIGQIAMLGQHTIQHHCNLVSQIGLSVSENEYYGITAIASTGLGLQSLLKDWGLDVDLVLRTNSSSGKSFASRQGLSKMKHIQIKYLWTQERLAKKHFTIEKIGTKSNHSDILTKIMSQAERARHMSQIGHTFRTGRSTHAKRVIKGHLKA